MAGVQEHQVRAQPALTFILLTLVVANTEMVTGAVRSNEVVPRSLRSGPPGEAACGGAGANATQLAVYCGLFSGPQLSAFLSGIFRVVSSQLKVFKHTEILCQ